MSKRVITKQDVYAPKRHAHKHKTKCLIGHGLRLIANGSSQRIPSAVVIYMMNPRWRRQPGKNQSYVGNALRLTGFWAFFDGLNAANAIQLDFFENRSAIAEVSNVE